MPKVPDSEWVLCGSYHFFKMFLFTRDAMNWREKTWTGGTSLTCWWRCCSWIPRKGSDPARFFNIPSSPWATSQLLRLPIVRNCLPLSSRVVYWLKRERFLVLNPAWNSWAGTKETFCRRSGVWQTTKTLRDEDDRRWREITPTSYYPLAFGVFW